MKKHTFENLFPSFLRITVAYLLMANIDLQNKITRVVSASMDEVHASDLLWNESL